MASQTDTPSQGAWSIASGRQSFARLVRAANASGFQLVFNRSRLVAAVIGRDLAQSLMERQEKRRYPTGEEALAALRAWRVENADLDLPEGDEDIFPRQKMKFREKSPFDEDDDR